MTFIYYVLFIITSIIIVNIIIKIINDFKLSVWRQTNEYEKRKKKIISNYKNNNKI